MILESSLAATTKVQEVSRRLHSDQTAQYDFDVAGASADLEPSATRVLLVDDHEIVCETIALAMAADRGVHFETANNINAAATRIAEAGRFDVILLDYLLPGVEGLEGLRDLIKANDGSVALFSGTANRMVVERALDAGASGFIPKTIPLKSLRNAIRFIADGETFLPAEFMRRTAQSDGESLGMKPREMRVLGLLCEGLQNKEIGRELGIEESTVKLDVKLICRKLGARNRTQAVIEARKRGMY